MRGKWLYSCTDITLAYTLCNVVTSSRNEVSHYSAGETLVEGILRLCINKERMHQALVYCGRCNVGTPSPLGLCLLRKETRKMAMNY